jgi:mannitol-specific phosphotransferase system IIBC component
MLSFNAYQPGVVAPPSPGSIFAYLAEIPKDRFQRVMGPRLRIAAILIGFTHPACAPDPEEKLKKIKNCREQIPKVMRTRKIHRRSLEPFLH